MCIVEYNVEIWFQFHRQGTLLTHEHFVALVHLIILFNGAFAPILLVLNDDLLCSKGLEMLVEIFDCFNTKNDQSWVSRAIKSINFVKRNRNDPCDVWYPFNTKQKSKVWRLFFSEKYVWKSKKYYLIKIYLYNIRYIWMIKI